MAVVWARCGRACTPAAARGSQRPADFNNEIQSGQSEIGRTTSIPSIVSRFGSRRPEVRVLSPRLPETEPPSALSPVGVWCGRGVGGGGVGAVWAESASETARPARLTRASVALRYRWVDSSSE